MTSAFTPSALASEDIATGITAETAFDGEKVGPESIARRRVRRRQMLTVIAMFYAVEAFILTLYANAGTTSFWVAPAHLLCGWALAGVFFLASETGFSDRFRDHYLTGPVTASNLMLQLCFLYAAPEVAVMFICELFMTFGFASLQITLSQAVIVWLVTTFGLSGTLLFSDKILAFPISTPVERVLTLITACFNIAGFIYVGLQGSQFRRALYNRSNELKQANRRIEELAEIDELTGAFNRRRMMRALDEECSRVLRTGAPFSVALIDLDHFKRINDRYGHPVGDEVLRTFALTAFANIRAGDRFGRYGGEEFLLLMPDTSADTATVLLDRLRAITADLDWSAYSSDLRVTISAGVSALRPGEAPDALLTRADAALYRSKDKGRNQITSS